MEIAWWIGVVFAWEPAEQRVIPTPVPVAGLATLDVGGLPWFLVTGPGGTALLDARGGVRGRSDSPAADLAISQHGDSVTAFLCGSSGVSALAVSSAGLGAPTEAIPGRCAAILKIPATGTEPAAILVAGEGLLRVPVRDGRADTPERLDEKSWKDPLLARAGDRIAIAERGGTEVTELGPWGRSSFRTEGPISGLAYGSEGIAWTVADPPSTADATRRTTILAAAPSELRTGAIVGPGTADRVVLHTGEPVLYGIVPRNGAEQVRPAPAGARGLLVDDIDLDGCTDLVIGGTSEIAWVVGQCEPGAVAVERPSNAPKPTPIIMNGDLPSITTRVGEEFWGQLYFPDGRRRRWSARAQPAGMLVLPDGLIRYTPMSDQVGRHEVYVRGGAVTQKLSIVVLPAAGSAGVQIAAPPGEERPPPAPPAPRKCLVGLGVALGASYAVADWDRVGSGPVAVGGSPAAMITCDSSISTFRAFFGFDTAPTFSYYAGPNVYLPHLAAITVGGTVGNDVLRAGPYGTLGLVVLGVGARVTWTPFKGLSPEVRRGFELRVTAFTPSTPAGEAMLLWVWRG